LFLSRGAWTKEDYKARLRHVAYAGGWKKFEPVWDWVIRAKRVSNMLPLLESALAGVGQPECRRVGLVANTRGRTDQQ